jgi:hypothetical protein
MALIERRSGEEVRGRERSLEIQVRGFGGVELRPTRFFLWAGGRREGHERVVSLGSPPQSLSLPRREREVRAGSVEVRSLGNPLITVALAGVHAVRKAVHEVKR